MLSKLAIALLMLSVSLSAHATPSATNLYVINEVIETTSHLLPGEKYAWYAAIPIDVGGHAYFGWATSGWKLAATFALGKTAEVVPGVVIGEDFRLREEATLRADHIIGSLTQIPGNRVLGLLSFSGDSKEGDGLFPTSDHKKSMYLFSMAEPLPENYSATLALPGGISKTVTFSRVENLADVVLTLSIRNLHAVGNPWTITLGDMAHGIRLPNEQHEAWLKIFEEDKKHSRVEVTMRIGEKIYELGAFAQADGVESFLGEKLLWGKISYWARRYVFKNPYLYPGVDIKRAKNLKLRQLDLSDKEYPRFGTD